MPLCQELTRVLDSIGQDYEILLVDDGSSDDTWSRIRDQHEKDPRISGLSFSRNFGHQMALFAGMNQAKGKIVVTMDGDLQHPPSLIPEMYALLKQGYDIVNTRRRDPHTTGWFKKWSSRQYYRLLNLLSDIQIEEGSSDFRMMSRKALDAYLDIPERVRFTRGLVNWIGFRQISIPYEADTRRSGTTKYSLKKMVTFGLNGITSFSSRPLRISFYSGIFLSGLGFLYALFALVGYLRGSTIPGWTSILLSVLVIGGVVLINLGIIGEYIARIFEEVKARPPYFIRESLGDTPGQKQQDHE